MAADVALLSQYQVEAYSGCSFDDIQLIERFADKSAMPHDDYYTDFAGIKTSPKALPYLQERCGTINHNLPFPDDFCHAEAIEYASLYQAIEATPKDSFTMFELGAGWGPWISCAAKGCMDKGFSAVSIVGVEGEGNKIPLIKEHLSINGMRADNDELAQTYGAVSSRIIHGVVTAKDKTVKFPVADVADYGASVLKKMASGRAEFAKVRGYSLKTLMRDFDTVDYMHFDIQGHEYQVVSTSLRELSTKVRYMCIATHSRKIEGDLFELLYGNGWRLLREMPCIYFKDISTVQQIDGVIKCDGTQFWAGPKS